jgi:hypothetical protein
MFWLVQLETVQAERGGWTSVETGGTYSNHSAVKG